MIFRMAGTWLVLGGLIMVGACAVEPVQETQNFTVTTAAAEGAHCKVTDSLGESWYVKSTPGSVMVRKGYGPLTVICSKENYKPATLVVGDTGSVVNSVGKYIGAAADYPAAVTVNLEPLHFRNEEERESWENDQIIREKTLEEQKHQCWFSPYHNC